MIETREIVPFEEHFIDQPAHPTENITQDGRHFKVKEIRRRPDYEKYVVTSPDETREIWYEKYASHDYDAAGEKVPYHATIVSLWENHMADEISPHRKREFFRTTKMSVAHKVFEAEEEPGKPKETTTVSVTGRWRNSYRQHNPVEYGLDGKKVTYDNASAYWFAPADMRKVLPTSKELPDQIDTAATVGRFLNQIAAFDFSDPTLILPSQPAEEMTLYEAAK